jgi:hypothetical protein
MSPRAGRAAIIINFNKKSHTAGFESQKAFSRDESRD